jgi:alpha-L-arabinofuranosidase
MNKLSTRRDVLTAGAAAAFSAITSRKAQGQGAAVKAQISVDARSEIGVIRPELHGHFAEHLGSCTYGGLWVGPNSPIPNIRGYRKAAVEYLSALGVPVLRWPGGCFADDYHWRDGIGPAARRPKRVNLWWGKYTEDNSFGTHEFVGLCRLIGAEPYFAGNVGSGTPAELREWMEYCNYPSGSTLADERAANGSPQLFNIKYWGVGNENWGCGGRMSAEEYATEYRRYATYLQKFGDIAPFLIGCGPSSNNIAWTQGFFKNPPRGNIHGYAMHFYSGSKLTARAFTPEAMYEQFSSFDRMEKAVLEQRAEMDKYDRERRIGLMIDEWGIWDRELPEEEKRLGKLWQQITTRCGVGAALALNVFHRQADKLIMCNIAQIMNVIHSMLLTDGDKCVRTPAYYAFELEKVHRGQTSLRSDAGTSGISMSASRGASLAITLVNPRHDTGVAVECGISGGNVLGARARVIAHNDLNACNTFEQPDTIVPRALEVAVGGGKVTVELPPMSVATITAQLG